MVSSAAARPGGTAGEKTRKTLENTAFDGGNLVRDLGCKVG